MRLVKLGRVVVNLDQVRCIHDLSTRDAAGNILRGLVRLDFDTRHSVQTSAGASELLNWLEGQSTNLMPLPPSS
jgi:hypothetical protein